MRATPTYTIFALKNKRSPSFRTNQYSTSTFRGDNITKSILIQVFDKFHNIMDSVEVNRIYRDFVSFSALLWKASYTRRELVVRYEEVAFRQRWRVYHRCD